MAAPLQPRRLGTAWSLRNRCSSARCAMIESMEATQRQPSAALPQGTEPVAPALYDWTVTLLSTWLIGGLFLDGWAHNHIASLETFFTPWHAVLYSGYAALAALYFVPALRNRRAGSPWQRVMPVGYQASLVGATVFGIGGGLDLLWHTIFGIERSVDALLSPTHLVLATGVILMVTGPLRAAWRKPDDGAPALRTLLPAILSMSYLLAVLRF